MRVSRSRAVWLWSMALCMTAILGCGKKAPESRKPAPVAAPATKAAPPTPIDEKRAELGGPQWDHAWDAMIEKALPPAMLSTAVPRDVRRYCPRFYSMTETNKRAFWAYLFQALAGAEAGLDPKTVVRHTEPEVNRIDRVTHVPVHQEGLLQLTYEDQKRYGCDFNWKADRKLPLKDGARTILQPRNNLLCGVKILKAQIIDHHEPLFTRRSYWSTLQPGTVSFRVFEKQMTNPPEACGLHEQPRARQTRLEQRAEAQR